MSDIRPMTFSPFASGGMMLTFYREQRIPEDFYPNAPLIFRHILYRRFKNMDTVIVVVGNKRSGKTYFALKCIEELSKLEGKHFDVDRQCFFDAMPFFKFMQSSADGYALLEEVGVGYNAQDWFTVQNKIFKNILQTQGFRKNVIFMTLPNIAYLLKGARFLLNFGVETIEAGKVSINKVVVKHLLGKGWLEYIETLTFSLPSKGTIEKYEMMKKIWNDKHLAQDILLMAKIEQQEAPIESETREKKLWDDDDLARYGIV